MAKQTPMRLVYTQHTVAFPTLKVSEAEPWHTDSVGISLESSEHSGSYGEMRWTFMTFSDPSHHGVQMTVFGDARRCFPDPRVQTVISDWLALPEPDEITPAVLIGWIESVGMTPSRYHLKGQEALA